MSAPVQYWGGPRDGQVINGDSARPDGVRLPVSEAPEGMYVLTTFPGTLRRVWAWWAVSPSRGGFDVSG